MEGTPFAVSSNMPVRRLMPLLLLPLLAGCEQVSDLLELPDPRKEEAKAVAEAKAIGGACRHSGRSLEDCYVLNPTSQKAGIFAGWREMNDYMMQNNITTVPSQLAPPPRGAKPGESGGEPAPAHTVEPAATGAPAERRSRPTA